MRRRWQLAMIMALVLWPGLALAAGKVTGKVVDQSGLALPGVTVRLVSTTPGAEPTSTVTTETGGFEFDTAPGDYRIETELSGFDPVVRSIHVGNEPLTVPDLVMGLAAFTQETTVVASLPTELQPAQFGAPSTIAEKVIDNAPLRSNRYEDLLPLLPNVVRGTDGLISVAGARAPQGVVMLNGVAAVDVATGQPLASVPLTAVESVQVITTGFPAEFGRSSGGVTVINSRSGSDVFRFSINSFTPRPRLADGGVKGIEAWDPNVGIRGPISPGKAWFAQSLDYHYERTNVETVTGDQDRSLHGFTSLSQVDFKPVSSHTMTGWFNGQRENVDGEGLSGFNPLGTVPHLYRNSWGGALVDRATIGQLSTLEARVEARRQELDLTPSGSGAYKVAHQITSGSYFETENRDALSVQGSVVFSRTWTDAWGNHLLKVGASGVHSSLNGNTVSSPVTYLRSSLALAQRVEFVGPGAFDTNAWDGGIFAQDSWKPLSALTLDLGVRLDAASRVGALVEPRAGLTWQVAERTTVNGGIGLFADKTPLAALAFPGYQSRRITQYDENGLPVSSTLYLGQVANQLQRPRAWLWSAQVDHHFGGVWQFRSAYQERHGSREFIITPAEIAGQTYALLTSGGESRSRSLEATLGFRPQSGGHQLYVSYVRSIARGNTNDLSQVEGMFKEPLLEAGQMAPLPTDVPHRLLVWGVFSLPSRTTVAPFLEWRSGFPYSAVTDDWRYTLPRYAHRYPTFASLDLVVNKVVTLPGGLRARVGVKLYNLAGSQNGRDVQRDIDRADFGTTYNALGRQVRGVFEIIWGEKK